MAFEFVSKGFQWFGDQVKRKIDQHIEDKMHATGQAVVARAQVLAPVNTGALRSSIGYVVALDESGFRHTLSIQVGMYYGIYQEFGTRHLMPHPFIRPALNEVGRIWGFRAEMMFAGTPGFAGLLASTGRGRGAGYAASHLPGWKPLTPRQLTHVQTHLIPGVKRHHTGNVKRSRFYVR